MSAGPEVDWKTLKWGPVRTFTEPGLVEFIATFSARKKDESEFRRYMISAVIDQSRGLRGFNVRLWKHGPLIVSAMAGTDGAA